jgi:LysR family transcriptional regulator, glycine cleavage system transcriptional activator
MKNLNRVGLGGLRAIEAVGRLGSLRAAADEIGVTPGAISQQVQKSEAQLGCALFERRAKGMMLTPRGQDVLRHLTSGMSELSAAVALALRHQEDTLTVSVAPVLAAKWLVWRLNGFHETHPHIRIRVDATATFVDPNTSDVDVCIRVGLGQWPGVHAKKLGDQRAFPVCSPALATRISCLEDLGSVPVIRDQGEMFGWHVWLEPNGLEEAILSEGPVFSNASLCLDAAIAGQGVFLAWETLACDALRSGRLVAPFPDRYPTGFSYWYVTGRYAARSRAVRDFEAWLRSALEASIDVE